MRKNDIEDKIKAVISRMTLEEKVGQLHQMGPTTSSTLAGYEVNIDDLLTEFLEGRMSEAQFQEKLGHQEESLNEDAVRDGTLGNFIGLYEPEKIEKVQKIAVEQSRMKIPLLVGADVIRGYRTIFPTPLAQSCSWNMELIEQAASVTAKEAWVAGIRWVFGPMLDIARDARWGRIVESAGEDPYLAAQVARASVFGYQGRPSGDGQPLPPGGGQSLPSGDDQPLPPGDGQPLPPGGGQSLPSGDDRPLPPGKIAACMKHFAAYGAVSGGQDYNTVDMSPSMLYNQYLPPFKAAVEAGVLSVMTAFNDLNGVPCTMDTWLIQDVLRGDMGFDGMVVSDAEAVCQCVVHGVAKDLEDATYKAIMAGNDMDMSSRCNDRYLAALVKSGKVPESRLDEAVANVLKMKYRAGLLNLDFESTCTAGTDTQLGQEENPQGQTCLFEYDKKAASDINLCPEHRNLSRRLACESMVLLENTGNVLPFSKNIRKLAVIGALADDAENFHGPWAFAGGRAEETVTILQGMKAALGKETEVIYAYGCDVQPEASANGSDETCLDAAVDAAAQCDAVILVAGENLFMSGEAASKAHLTLTGRQEELIRRVCAVGKPVAVVLVNGRSLEIGWFRELPCAVLEAWYPGTEGGHAVADIIFGKVNPSGHLSVTFANTAGQEPMYYNHPNTGKPGGKFKFTSKYQDAPVTPLYPFGYGLSYTAFEYSELKIMPENKACTDGYKGDVINVNVDEVMDIEITVKNTGAMDGADVVQLYVQDVTASMVRPVKELKGFKKLWIPAGEERTCHFQLPVTDLGFYNRNLEYVVEPGKFRLWAGSDSSNGLEGEINV